MRAVAISLAAAAMAPAAFGSIPADCDGCFCVPGNGGTDPCPSWVPVTEFSDDLVNDFKNKKLTNPFADLDCNPYEDEACVTSPAQVMVDMDGVVCAFKYSTEDCSEYSMITYGSQEEADADGAFLTHTGACGLCSTAQDLAVYMANPDMTSAGKKCATKALINESWGKSCYEALGYTTPCASIWNFDGIYDGQNCKWTCITHLFSDLNGPPPTCELNPCLQCDEDEAGPLFKAFAARTRRRSGLASAIARGCDEFPQIIHEACPAPVSVVSVE